ncbi:DNA polymerase III subunit beta [Streptomyces sp. F001]|nr:DNA polymerase III subunit beta [Streptomyces sp. F001]
MIKTGHGCGAETGIAPQRCQRGRQALVRDCGEYVAHDRVASRTRSSRPSASKRHGHVRDVLVQVRINAHTCPRGKLEEYPALPEAGATSGALPGPAFAEAIAQVACAVGKDDTLPVLTGIQLRHDQEDGTLTLAATDRYRFAVRTIAWKNCDLTADCTALAPGKPLLDAVKAVADDTTIDLALPDAAGVNGLFTLRTDHSTTTLRGLEGDLPKYQSLFPTEFNHTATVEIAALKDAVQRVALVAAKESPLRLTFAADDTLVLEAGTSDDAQAVDNVDTNLDGDELTVAFNPAFLLDGLNTLTAESVDFHFTTSTKPAVLRGHGSDEQALRYLLMPIRVS